MAENKLFCCSIHVSSSTLFVKLFALQQALSVGSKIKMFRLTPCKTKTRQKIYDQDQNRGRSEASDRHLNWIKKTLFEVECDWNKNYKLADTDKVALRGLDQEEHRKVTRNLQKKQPQKLDTVTVKRIK